MADITQIYATPALITFTPASLAANGWRMSNVIDNAGANYFVDALVGLLVRVGTLSATGYLTLYAYGTFDDNEYTSGLNNAADATITWGTTGRSGLLGHFGLPMLGQVTTDATDDDDYVTLGPYSVAGAFGGIMPRKWGVVLLNGTGVGLHATQTDTILKYSGVKYNVT